MQVAMHHTKITRVKYIAKHGRERSPNVALEDFWDNNVRDDTSIAVLVEVDAAGVAQRVLFIANTSFLLCYLLVFRRKGVTVGFPELEAG